MHTEKKRKDTQVAEWDDLSFLSGLTDEELDDLLDTAADEDDPDQIDDALIGAILDEIERRGADEPDPFPDEREVEAAFGRFKERLEAEGLLKPVYKRNMRKSFKIVFAGAACILLIIAVSIGTAVNASADDYSFWDKLVAWTKETFHLGDIEAADEQEPNVQMEVLSLFSELDHILRENDIKVALPTWVPEGYSTKDVSVDDDGITITITSWFRKEYDEFSIQVTAVNGETVSLQSSLEENRGKGEVYLFGRVEHYITVNEADGVLRYNAVWQQDDYMVRLQGDFTETEMKRMINSIYERV